MDFRSRFFRTLLAGLIGLTAACHLGAQVQYSASTHLEAAFADTSESRYLENWTDVLIGYGDFRGGLRYEVHQPAASFSQQPDSYRLAHRYLEYRYRGFGARVGTFYALLGRGLTLRAFESRALRWDSNIDGVKADFRHALVDVTVLSGKIRKTRLDPFEQDQISETEDFRLDRISGGELIIKPHRRVQAGGTYVYSHPVEGQTPDGFHRGSLLAQLTLPMASFYGEVATLRYPEATLLENARDGQALYLSGSAWWRDLQLLGEYRDYDDYKLEEGLVQNPPTAIEEHLFALMNRRQFQQDIDLERGYLFQATHPVTENGLLKASYSHTEDQGGNRIYQDIYGQLDWYSFLNGEWLLAMGRQEDVAARYLNVVGSAAYAIGSRHYLKTIFEHQHARVDLTGRQYYDQLLTLEYTPGAAWTLSFLGEHSTDQFADSKNVDANGYALDAHHFWGGVQVSATVLERIDISVFGGTRRKGKICIGGVCVVKPELEGVELTLTTRL